MPQGPEKNQKIVRPQCLDGVATINTVKWQLQTTLWPDNVVTLSRQNCRVPSSVNVQYFVQGISNNFLTLKYCHVFMSALWQVFSSDADLDPWSTSIRIQMRISWYKTIKVV